MKNRLCAKYINYWYVIQYLYSELFLTSKRYSFDNRLYCMGMEVGAASDGTQRAFPRTANSWSNIPPTICCWHELLFLDQL